MRNPEVAGSKCGNARIPPPAPSENLYHANLDGGLNDDSDSRRDQFLQLDQRRHDYAVRCGTRDYLRLRVRSPEKAEEPDLVRDLLDLRVGPKLERNHTHLRDLPDYIEDLQLLTNLDFDEPICQVPPSDERDFSRVIPNYELRLLQARTIPHRHLMGARLRQCHHLEADRPGRVLDAAHLHELRSGSGGSCSGAHHHRRAVAVKLTVAVRALPDSQVRDKDRLTHLRLAPDGIPDHDPELVLTHVLRQLELRQRPGG